MKKELDFWAKSTTMGARDWCDRLRQAEQKFREAAEKNARLERGNRSLSQKKCHSMSNRDMWAAWHRAICALQSL